MIQAFYVRLKSNLSCRIIISVFTASMYELHKNSSNIHYLLHGVPQESILGPNLFHYLHTFFPGVIKMCNMYAHADYVQLYHNFTLDN